MEQKLVMPAVMVNVRQLGFSLVEVSIVTAIMMLIAIVGIPAIQSYVIESKVPRVAEELQRFVARVKANTHGFGATPYAAIDNVTLATAMRGSSVLSISGDGVSANIAHGLGGPGVSGRGVISVEPQTWAGSARGAAFSVTLSDVNVAACPALASILQKIADMVSISGKGGPVIVKNNTYEPYLAYNPMLADSQCAQGDRNTFQFTIR